VDAVLMIFASMAVLELMRQFTAWRRGASPVKL
jgi:hypothetical protein